MRVISGRDLLKALIDIVQILLHFFKLFVNLFDFFATAAEFVIRHHRLGLGLHFD